MLVFMNVIESAPEQSKFISICERYKKLMYYVAYKILQNHEDAEEAVNDALWQVAQNLNKISDPDGPRTKRLIVIITERKAIDLYRKNRRHAVVPLECPGRSSHAGGCILELFWGVTDMGKLICFELEKLSQWRLTWLVIGLLPLKTGQWVM